MRFDKSMEKAVFRTVREHQLIENGDLIILGLSGGPDSLSLLYLLKSFQKEEAFKIVVCHVNHLFREEAYLDEEFCKGVCQKEGIEYFSKTVDCNKLADDLHMTCEEAGRKARYDFFVEIADRYAKQGFSQNNIKIGVAQNKNDQVETVVFRIIRGTGNKGLAAMDYKRSHGEYKVIRPILDIDRSEVERYCEENGFDPRIDMTNKESLYARNKIRLELLPLLREYNPNIDDAIVRLSQNAREDNIYLEGIATKVFDQGILDTGDGKIVLDLNRIKHEDKAIIQRVIILALEKIGLCHNISRDTIVAAEKIIKKSSTENFVEFPKKYRMKLSYGKIIFEKNEICNSHYDRFDGKFKVEYMEELQYGEAQKIVQDRKKKNLIVFDLDVLKEESGFNHLEKEEFIGLIKLRQRMAEDAIRLKVGHKKIKKLFIDMKIPRDDRNHVPLIALGKEILWMPDIGFGSRVAAYKYPEEDTKSIVFLEFSRKI